MKLVHYNDFTLGALNDGGVVDISGIVQEIPHVGPHDLINGLIERWEEYRPALARAVGTSRGIPLEQVRVRAPLPRPGKMVCMARNYLESGMGEEPPPFNAFLKSPNAVIGPGEKVILPGAPATIFEHEAELGVIVGRTASRITAKEASDYIFGYVNFIDVSARGLGNPVMDTFYPVKSWRTFAPMGPYLVSAEEIPDQQNMPVKLWVNGDLRQDYTTGEMARTIEESLARASHILTLEPGDVFACGTDHSGLGPLQDADVVEMEIPGLGRLRLTVQDDLKREWPRETRAQKEAYQEKAP